MNHFEKAKLINAFVEFLIREECQGCTECEPRLSTDWKPNFACISEGYAKHFMDCGERFLKAESEVRNDQARSRRYRRSEYDRPNK